MSDLSWESMSDDELLAALGDAVAETGAVSDRRRDAARAAFTWRTVDEELAELLHDSLLDAGAAVRSSGGTPRALTFGRSGITVEVEVDGDQVLGEVVDGAGAAVTLQRPDLEDGTVEADAAGFFRFSGVGAGLVRFVVEVGGFSLTTPWVTL
ncbi:MAG TPA: hypothetical protein VJ872_11790 [Nocardioides sp.]|nr:hypothetical protein [Nocardioides sp.]